MRSLPLSWYLNRLGAAYLSVGSFENAIGAYLECLRQVPALVTANLGLTLAYMEAGREKEGRAQARKLLHFLPEFSSSSNPRLTSFMDRAIRERYTALLRKAGLPE